MKSAPKPSLLPFLKKSLPYIQQSLAAHEITIEGIRSPIISQNGKLGPFEATDKAQEDRKTVIIKATQIDKAEVNNVECKVDDMEVSGSSNVINTGDYNEQVTMDAENVEIPTLYPNSDKVSGFGQNRIKVTKWN